MTKQTRMSVSVLLALVVLALSLGAQSVPAQGPSYSVWLVRSSVFKDVPAGAFMPDRAFVPGSTSPMNNQIFFQLPVKRPCPKPNPRPSSFPSPPISTRP